MAIARLDGVQYEYATFDTDGTVFGEGGFTDKYDELSRKDFRSLITCSTTINLRRVFPMTNIPQ